MVQYARETRGSWVLWIRSGGQKLEAVALEARREAEEAGGLIGQRVRARGVACASVGSDGDIETLQLHLNSLDDDCQSLGGSEPESADIRVLEVGDLRAWLEASLPDYPVRLEGVVESDPSGGYVLRDATGTLPLRPRNAVVTGVALSARAEGFLEKDETGRLILADVHVRQSAPCRPQPKWSPPASGGPPEEQPILTGPREVRRLNEAQAARGFMVRFDGVVTWLDRDRTNICVQERGMGVFVDLTNRLDSALAPGSLVEVWGYSGRGHFSPFVREAELRIVGGTTLASALDRRFRGDGGGRPRWPLGGTGGDRPGASNRAGREGST